MQFSKIARQISYTCSGLRAAKSMSARALRLASAIAFTPATPTDNFGINAASASAAGAAADAIDDADAADAADGESN